MNRIEHMKMKLLKEYEHIQDLELRHHAIEHSCTTATIASLLANQFNENQELTYLAGLYHDYYRYTYNQIYDHAKKGAPIVRQIFQHEELFHLDEIILIEEAILYHSDKTKIHSLFCQIIKCADRISQQICDNQLNHLNDCYNEFLSSYFLGNTTI